jgi:hypothetical protein
MDKESFMRMLSHNEIRSQTVPTKMKGVAARGCGT